METDQLIHQKTNKSKQQAGRSWAELETRSAAAELKKRKRSEMFLLNWIESQPFAVYVLMNYDNIVFIQFIWIWLKFIYFIQ